MEDTKITYFKEYKDNKNIERLLRVSIENWGELTYQVSYQIINPGAIITDNIKNNGYIVDTQLYPKMKEYAIKDSVAIFGQNKEWIILFREYPSIFIEEYNLNRKESVEFLNDYPEFYSYISAINKKFGQECSLEQIEVLKDEYEYHANSIFINTYKTCEDWINHLTSVANKVCG